MEEKEIALRIERIKRALENEGIEADEKKLREEFLRYLQYDIKPDEAEMRILRKNGVRTAMAVKKKIAEIGPEDGFVTVAARIVSINSATTGDKVRHYGILGDETGTIPFSAWDVEELNNYSKGDSVEINGAIVREWNGVPQLRISKKTVITKLDEEINIKFSPKPTEEAKLADISDGDRVSIMARILSIEEREINIRGEARTIYSGIMADETAKVPFTAWKDFGLKVGDVIKVDGAYVRSWKGVPQINIDEGMDIEKVDEEFPSAEELDAGRLMRIEELEGRSGMTDVMFEGNILQIRQGSGLIFRCPECRRVLNNGICSLHGEIDEPVPDLRIKAVLDDGTGAINVIVGRAITERILGKDVDECVKEARKKMEKGVIAKQIAEILALMPVRVRGNVVSDDNGYTLITTDMEIIDEDPGPKAHELIEEWGV